MAHRHLITDPTTAEAFVLAGKAFFTVANTKTENHATYRVELDDDGVHHIALFMGTENTDRRAYTEFATLADDTYTTALRTEAEVAREVRAACEAAGDDWGAGLCDSVLARLLRGDAPTAKQAKYFDARRKRHGIAAAGEGGLSNDHPKVRGFQWLLRRLRNPAAMDGHVQFWTEGRCCTCGRKLTNPDSVEALEGPVCAGRRGTVLTGTVLPLTTPAPAEDA